LRSEVVDAEVEPLEEVIQRDVRACDAAANPVGFDRLAFLADLDDQDAGFFAEQWR
jgi:hypothetical protein